MHNKNQMWSLINVKSSINVNKLRLMLIVIFGILSTVTRFPASLQVSAQGSDSQPSALGTQRAALLRVIYDEVEVRRANTTEWLALAVGSESPFGVGDTLRTSPYGRVHLRFASDLETLVLPSSTLELLTFEGDSEIRLHLRVEGRSIHITPSSDAFESYRLETAFYAVTSPPQHFAVQTGMSVPSNSAEAVPEAAISVAEGSAAVETGDETVIDVDAGFGMRVREGDVTSTPTALDYPAHFAQLEGLLDGCSGLVMARGEESLNVRVGPGLGYDEVGIAENNASVPLLGVTIGADRYRIPFLSGFGWILAIGVQTDCDNLPVYPYNTLEVNNGVIQAEARELELLQPFYGTPEEDYWFYR